MALPTNPATDSVPVLNPELGDEAAIIRAEMLKEQESLKLFIHRNEEEDILSVPPVVSEVTAFPRVSLAPVNEEKPLVGTTEALENHVQVAADPLSSPRVIRPPVL